MNESQLMQNVVRAAFNNGDKSTLKNTNLNQDLVVIKPYLLIDSETQAINLKKLIWNAAGFFGDDSKPKQPTNKDKKNALVHFYRLFSAFTKALRYHVVARQKPIFIAKIGMFKYQKPYFTPTVQFAQLLELPTD